MRAGGGRPSRGAGQGRGAGERGHHGRDGRQGGATVKQAGGDPGGVGADRPRWEMLLCLGKGRGGQALVGDAALPGQGWGLTGPGGRCHSAWARMGAEGPARGWQRATGLRRERRSDPGLSAKQSGQAGGRLDEERTRKNVLSVCKPVGRIHLENREPKSSSHHPVFEVSQDTQQTTRSISLAF